MALFENGVYIPSVYGHLMGKMMIDQLTSKFGGCPSSDNPKCIGIVCLRL
jgi:hypothetical protein